MKRETDKKWQHYKESRYSEFVRTQNYPKERKRIIKLQKELRKLGEFPTGNPKKIILYTVGFLDLVSQFQDEGYLQYQPQEKVETQKAFNLVIKNSGRQDSPNKWNYTKKGETVTTQNVLLGGVLGLPIKPASYWISRPKNKKVTIDYRSKIAQNPKDKSNPIVDTRTIWETQAIVEAGVERFSQNNAEVLMRCIKSLLS